jgi:phosphoglycerate dehydrogenase-like enzyme
MTNDDHTPAREPGVGVPVSARRVAVISENASHAPAELARLSAHGFEVVNLSASARTLAGDDLVAALEGTWGVVAGGLELYTRAVLDRCPDLRVIARFGVGYENVDVDAATDRRVAVLITPGANAEAVADYTIGLMLASLRRIVLADADVRAGRWRSGDPPRDLYGSTVGIVGFGKIGQAVARRLRAFGCTLLAVEPFPDVAACEALEVKLMALDEVLPAVDVLTIHVPLAAATNHLIGARELSLMKPAATVINTSRGSVVDGAALAQALRDGTIAGAALDVFETEPLPSDHELLSAPNLVVTGHLAGFSAGAMQGVIRALVDGMIDVDEGRVPKGCVNPAVLATVPKP